MRRLALTVAASCLVLACIVHRTEYVYVQLTVPEPDAVELGEPPVDGYRGEPVSVSYRYRHAEGDISVALGRQSFVPSLEIESPVPITVEAGPCAAVAQRSPTEVDITWYYWRPPSKSCLSVGDSVEVTIAFTGTAQLLELSGNVRQGGTFLSFDSI